jgi:hypothetical protein
MLEQEKDFLIAFETRMFTMQTDMKKLIQKSDEERIRCREANKTEAIGGERSWFRKHALEINEQMK